MYSCYWLPLQFFGVFFFVVSKMQLQHKKWWCQRARLSVLAAVTTDRDSQALLWPVASVWRWGNIHYFEVLGFNLEKRKRQCRYFDFPDCVWAVLQSFNRINMWHYKTEVTSDSRWRKRVECGHMGMSRSARGRLWGAICHTLMKTIKLTRTLTLWFVDAVLDLVLCFSQCIS